MKGRMMKKKTMYLAMALCLMFAGASMAADYLLTGDTVPAGTFGGTITWDSAVGVSFADGGITAFSLQTPGAPGVIYSETDQVSDLSFTVDGALNPLTLMIDIDDLDGSGTFMYLTAPIDFTTGLGTQDNPTVEITNAALTLVPEPATMGLLALGGLMLRRRKRA